MGRGGFLILDPDMELPGPQLFRAGEEASWPVSMVSASPEPALPPPPPLSSADTRPSYALQVVRRDMKSVFFISPNVDRSHGGARVHRRCRFRRASRRSWVQWKARLHAGLMGTTCLLCHGGVRRKRETVASLGQELEDMLHDTLTLVDTLVDTFAV
jgi:hypothetical protein